VHDVVNDVTTLIYSVKKDFSLQHWCSSADAVA